MRRSLMLPSSAMAMASRSAASATGAPWKLPPESISPLSAKTMGLSVAALISMETVRVANASASRTVPCTWGMQRSV